MKIIIRILIGLGVLVVFVLIVALFTENEYNVERQISINRPKQGVFDYIKMLKNQDNFSKWSQMDPNMKKDYSGTDGTVGFTASWASENNDVGKGSQTIAKITEGAGIDTDLHFIEPFEGKADAHMKTDAIATDQTNVSWSIHSKMPFPMNITLLFINMDELMGRDLEVGLLNLKKQLEN